MEITKSKDKNLPNCVDWKGLTIGELLTIAQLCGASPDHPIAHDLYCEIRCYFYKIDQARYEYIEKNYNKFQKPL
jgi:hypothetical protein